MRLLETVGSSEAIMLAGLALKRNWQNKRKAEGKNSQEHLQKDLDDILKVLHELDTLPYKISRKMGAEYFGNVKGKKVKREKPMEVIVGWRKFVKDTKKMNGDSRLRITAETAPVVVLGGVDACRWRQDAKAPARTPLLHGDNRSLAHEPLLR
ncbi:hypothetical protein YC2023_041288 [Brassica napus]